MLNQSSLNTSILPPIDHYQKFLYGLTCWIKKSKKRTNQHQKQRSKMFLWYRVSHINPSKEHPERISKIDKKNLLSILLIQKKLQKKIKSLLVILIMMELSFLCKKNISARLKWKPIHSWTCLVTKMSFYNVRFTSKIWRLNGLVAFNWWWWITLCIH